MGRGIVLKCINCGQPCEEEQLNCASCQRNLDNEQDEGSSLIDKELEVYVGDNIRITKGNGNLRISGLLGGVGMVGRYFQYRLARIS